MVPLKRVMVPKASDLLAGQLRERILAGHYAEGKLLPNERELSERTGLGRTSVREALRILEVEGLILTRPGRNGGSAIQRPGAETFQRSLNLFIWGQKINLDTLIEVRVAIEPSAARFAAQHRTDEDLAAIDAIHGRLIAAADDTEQFRTANVDWHAAIVRASHNVLLVTFYDTIVGVVHAGTDVEGFHSREVRQEVIRAHERITEAIRTRDSEAAARRMFKHMDAYGTQMTEWLRANGPGSAEAGLRRGGAARGTAAPASRGKRQASPEVRARALKLPAR